MPIGSTRGVLGVPALSRRLGRATFVSPPLSTKGFAIAGVTRDSSGIALAGCTVDLYLSSTRQRVATTVSDGSGNYSFGATVGPYFVVSYKAGAPDVMGTTANTLTGV